MSQSSKKIDLRSFSMKIQSMIALLTFIFPIQGAMSDPYAANDDLQRSESMNTIDEEERGYDATNDDGVAFPRPIDRSKQLRPHHRAERPILDIISTPPLPAALVAIAEPDTQRSKEPSHGESMRQFSTVEPAAVFDREAYLRSHVQGLIEDEERFGRATRGCRWCNITWNGLGGATTATSLIVSAIGASSYMDPRLANIITIILGVFSGGCIWAGTQAKKASHQYHEKQNDIQKSLGVPKSWLDREVRIEIDQFNGRGVLEASAAPTCVAH